MRIGSTSAAPSAAASLNGAANSHASGFQALLATARTSATSVTSGKISGNPAPVKGSAEEQRNPAFLNQTQSTKDAGPRAQEAAATAEHASSASASAPFPDVTSADVTAADVTAAETKNGEGGAADAKADYSASQNAVINPGLNVQSQLLTTNLALTATLSAGVMTGGAAKQPRLSIISGSNGTPQKAATAAVSGDNVAQPVTTTADATQIALLPAMQTLAPTLLPVAGASAKSSSNQSATTHPGDASYASSLAGSDPQATQPTEAAHALHQQTAAIPISADSTNHAQPEPRPANAQHAVDAVTPANSDASSQPLASGSTTSTSQSAAADVLQAFGAVVTGMPGAAASVNSNLSSTAAGGVDRKLNSGATQATNTSSADADGARSKASTVGSAPSDSSHSVQSNGAIPQQLQSDATQPDAIAAKASDNAALQAQPVSAHATATTHESASSRGASPTPDDSSRLSAQRAESAASQADNALGSAPQSINTARVLQTMSESEMRVGMHSADFGDISIRTTISQQQMVAQISVNHGDLGQAISAHVSTVQSKLASEYGLHASIEVNQSNSSFSSGTGQSSPREQQSYNNSARIQNMIAPAEIESSFAPAALAAAGDGYRLDIRA